VNHIYIIRGPAAWHIARGRADNPG
jgi:hypothetical protein